MGASGVKIKAVISTMMILLLTQALGSFTDLKNSVNKSVTIERDANGLQSPFYGRMIFAVLSLLMSCCLSAMFGKWRLLSHDTVDGKVSKLSLCSFIRICCSP